MDAHAETISTLLSYSVTDFSVSSGEENRIIELVRTSPNLEKTLKDLKRNGFLSKLFDRVDSGRNGTILVESIAGRISRSGYSMTLSAIKENTSNALIFERSFALQQSLNKYGISVITSNSSGVRLRAALSVLAPLGAGSQPFSGSGATGLDPKRQSISNIDKALLAFKHEATVKEYINPLSEGISGYLRSLSPQQRRAQGILLLNRPIVTVYPNSYYGALPTRHRIIRLAAEKYYLEPALVAAVLLAEQRDQSQKEDAKDYIAATSFMKGDTSLGLGQVKVSTAREHDLFSDLLPNSPTANLAHSEISRLLTSEEYNIFAVSKYIRLVADMAARKNVNDLEVTKKVLPNIRLDKFSGHSAMWPHDNIRAIGSEYTSLPWDDEIVQWADFVFEAYKDIKNGGVF